MQMLLKIAPKDKYTGCIMTSYIFFGKAKIDSK